ncbi:MAG: P-II family nitrogen regulator [Candidatus Methylomirabilales bacterium]
MKEIKAYIRLNMIDKVIRALEGVGVSNMTVIAVKAVWQDMRPEDLQYSLELAKKYMDVAKLEIVTRDEDTSRLIELIAQAARTGRSGDGLIYVSSVEDAVHIRTGAQGEEALRVSEQ